MLTLNGKSVSVSHFPSPKAYYWYRKDGEKSVRDRTDETWEACPPKNKATGYLNLQSVIGMYKF